MTQPRQRTLLITGSNGLLGDKLLAQADASVTM